MISPPIPPNEEERLFTLLQLRVLDTQPEEAYDKITRLVAAICDVPIALVSLVDADRQWFKSSVGLAVCETSRDSSFCAHAINEPESIFIIEDTLADQRFARNPLVVGEPYIRFYAGVPLRLVDGSTLGSLCVIDQTPRTLSDRQLAALRAASRSVVALLEHRRAYLEVCEAFAPATARPNPPAARLLRQPPIGVLPIDDPGSKGTSDLPADVIDALPGIFYVLDSAGRFILWNDRLETITGYARSEIAASYAIDHVGERDRDLVRENFRTVMAAGMASVDATLATKDGRTIPFFFTAKTVQYRGQTCIAGMALDISERKQAEDLLRYASLHDPLTGLGNRTLLLDRLRQSARLALANNGHVAVLFLDLDRFKVINDTLGHSAGDTLLKAVAQRIRRRLPHDDTVVRLGGDEFVIVSVASCREAVSATVDAVMDAFREPFTISGRVLHLTTSLGVSVFPTDSEDHEHLLRNADSAMYHAKERGRNTSVYFTRDMHRAAVNRLATEIDLHVGLENGEFELYYQPVIDVRTGVTVSAEALLRWHHPERGLVPPDEFIAIAEESNLILPVGVWVAQMAARQARRLTDLGIDKFYLSFNVSARQLRDPGFLGHIVDALDGAKPARYSLGIEITESAALGDPDLASAVLDECKRLGLVILLDDFGTHYSSLTYLKKFPIDVIKIDRSFVAGLPDDIDDCGIVKAIVALGLGLDCVVLAEGVETPVQADWLAKNNCFYATGYLYAKPMPAAEFEAWLIASRERDRRLAAAFAAATD